MALNTWAVSILRYGAGYVRGIRMNYTKLTERRGHLRQ